MEVLVAHETPMDKMIGMAPKLQGRQNKWIRSHWVVPGIHTHHIPVFFHEIKICSIIIMKMLILFETTKKLLHTPPYCHPKPARCVPPGYESDGDMVRNVMVAKIKNLFHFGIFNIAAFAQLCSMTMGCSWSRWVALVRERSERSTKSIRRSIRSLISENGDFYYFVPNFENFQ